MNGASAGSKREVVGFILLVQAAALILALAWGALARIPWWQRYHWDLWVPAALVAGLALSRMSLLLFRALRGVPWLHTEWVERELLGPLFRGLSPGGALVVALASGIAEEALFRGVALPVLGLPASSLLFGLLHTGDRRLVGVGLWATAVGFGLGWLYLATGNLALPTALHAASNFASLYALARQRD
ncbi:MAG TPA: CPBP family intramembrane glutamic endopeptidase [Candidatus Nitrosotenuis sp.]|jgi:membrane protease YdiL (CAAX protease family)|nr:CPBP family intramembrane glutamic endopeptidase [Candidatus Nitrosotenuis sp.]